VVTLTTEEFEVLTPEERKAHMAQEEMTVFGRTTTNEPAFQRDAKGNPVERGIGSPGRQSVNSLAAIRKWEGEDAYQAAVDAVWKNNPEHAKRLNLPKRRGTS
jgi:hypothetical protein